MSHCTNLVQGNGKICVRKTAVCLPRAAVHLPEQIVEEARVPPQVEVALPPVQIPAVLLACGQAAGMVVLVTPGEALEIVPELPMVSVVMRATLELLESVAGTRLRSLLLKSVLSPSRRR